MADENTNSVGFLMTNVNSKKVNQKTQKKIFLDELWKLDASIEADKPDPFFRTSIPDAIKVKNSTKKSD